MKQKDVKIAGLNQCFGSVDNVGELQDFLSQFPKNIKVRAFAEADACDENGYDWINVGVETKLDIRMRKSNGRDKEPTEEEDAESEVMAVILRVDHC